MNPETRKEFSKSLMVATPDNYTPDEPTSKKRERDSLFPRYAQRDTCRKTFDVEESLKSNIDGRAGATRLSSPSLRQYMLLASS